MQRNQLRPRETIRSIETAAFKVPTDFPEADGTLEWKDTTIVVVWVRAHGCEGLGYTYSDKAAADLISRTLAPVVTGQDPMAISACWWAMLRAVRNLGRPGLCSAAVSAVDVALWDLKARLLGLPLVSLLGPVRDAVPVYGSGGFTSYPLARLQGQLAAWCSAGLTRVKMKVGSDPDADLDRVTAARDAIGPAIELFVDANGAYDRKQALNFANRFAGCGVSWFEEPVSSDDLEGLRLLRDRGPVGMDIAAGEYGCTSYYFRRMLAAGAVDVLQADATRCAGITGLMRVGALCQAHHVPLSAHTAPALHLHPCCAIGPVRHVEYFHDHVNIERMFFDGVQTPVEGSLRPDLTRPGMGLTFQAKEAVRYAA